MRATEPETSNKNAAQRLLTGSFCESSSRDSRWRVCEFMDMNYKKRIGRTLLEQVRPKLLNDYFESAVSWFPLPESKAFPEHYRG